MKISENKMKLKIYIIIYLQLQEMGWKLKKITLIKGKEDRSIKLAQCSYTKTHTHACTSSHTIIHTHTQILPLKINLSQINNKSQMKAIL